MQNSVKSNAHERNLSSNRQASSFQSEGEEIKKKIVADFDLSAFDTLLAIVKVLRSEVGCPWDREQTFSSLKKHVMEECAELLDAVDQNHISEIKEELGDMLLHIVFFSQIAMENNFFSINDVIKGINSKLIRRHPHVFADKTADNPDEVLVLWKSIKKQEKQIRKNRCVLDSVPENLPSLFKAEKMQKRAAEYGFDWHSETQILEKIEEELQELKDCLNLGDGEKIEEELGDLLFSIINLIRFRRGSDSDAILKKAIKKFKRRFCYMERRLAERGVSLNQADIQLMDKYWNEGKNNI